MMDWSKRGNINTAAVVTILLYPQAPNGSAGVNRKKQLLPNRLVEDRELEAPTAANHAPVLMPALRAAVAQKDPCHLVRHLRVHKAR